LRCRRGKNLADLIGELLQAFLETPASPFAAFSHDLLFDFG
jgi:hypothetical protein